MLLTLEYLQGREFSNCTVWYPALWRDPIEPVCLPQVDNPAGSNILLKLWILLQVGLKIKGRAKTAADAW